MAGEVWLREPRAYRTTPPLTRGRIVAAAVELLDADGADGLTMRRLAVHLGAASTTLYWHVRTKDDVLDLARRPTSTSARMPAPTRRSRPPAISASRTGTTCSGGPWTAC